MSSITQCLQLRIWHNCHTKLGQTVPAQSPARWSRGRTIKPGTRQFRGPGTHQTQRVNTSSRTNNKYDQHITQIAKCAFFQLHTCSEKYDQRINSIVVIESIDSKYVAHLERKKEARTRCNTVFFDFSKHQKVHLYECPQGGGSSITSTFSFAQPICQTPMKR